MFYKGCMRRGVSLEVIVEEDDGAQVSFGASDPEDEDCRPSSSSLSSERDEKSTTDCERESKRNQDSFDQDSDQTGHRTQRKLKEEKKKRKRKKAEWIKIMERRRRSVSCETLTVLSVGEDKASQDAWAEEVKDYNLWCSDDPFDPYSSQTISRKKILQSCLMNSPIEDQEDLDQSPNHQTDHSDIYESVSPQRSLSESEPENGRRLGELPENDPIYAEVAIIVDKSSSSSDNLNLNSDTEAQNAPFESDSERNEAETSWRTDANYQDVIRRDFTAIDREKTISEGFNEDTDSLGDYDFVDVRGGAGERWQKDPFSTENGVWPSKGPCKAGGQLFIIRDCPLDDIGIENNHEKGHQETRGKERNGLPPSTTESGLNLTDAKTREPTLQNEVTIVERIAEKEQKQRLDDLWPPPNSDSAENTSQVRLKEIPESRRNKELHPDELPKPHTVASVRQMFEGVDGKTKFKDFYTDISYGIFDHVRSNPSSKILRFERERQQRPRDLSPKAENQETKSQENLRPLQDEWIANGTSRGGKSPYDKIKEGVKAGSGQAPPVAGSSKGGGGGMLTLKVKKGRHDNVIHLRKPTVACNFNVEKALRDNPRDFHVKVRSRGDLEAFPYRADKPEGANHCARTSATHIVPHIKANKFNRNQNGSAIDRNDDSESWTSESSEDSGVLRDFSSSSIISSFTKTKEMTTPIAQSKTFNQHADPNFKWIDPRILAKIRSAGTTVIFFGPRYRHQKKPAKSPQKAPEAETKEEPRQNNFSKTEETSCKVKSFLKGVDSPRIVGVVHKTNDNPAKTPAVTILKKGIKASSTQRNREVTWRTPTSTVYDFTRKASAVQNSTEGYR